MLKSIFLIEWDNLVRSNPKGINGTHKSLNGSNNNGFECEQLRVVIPYPVMTEVLNNEIALKKIVEPHIARIAIEEEKMKDGVGKKPTKDDIQIIFQEVFDFSICSCFIHDNRLLCFVFDLQDNPSEYKDLILKDLELYILTHTYYISSEVLQWLENGLAIMFVDLRAAFLINKESSEFLIDDPNVREQLEDAYKNKTTKLYMYGIDAAGKSSFIRFVKSGKYDHNYFSPTKRFMIHKLKLFSKLKIVCWEMPGQKMYRRIWVQGLQASDIIVFVLDAADPGRFAEAKRAFWSIVNRFEIKNKPVLFLANKIDLIDNRHKLAEIEDYFGLKDLKDRKWVVKFVSLVTKEGLKDSLDWLIDVLEQNVIGEIGENLS